MISSARIATERSHRCLDSGLEARAIDQNDSLIARIRAWIGRHPVAVTVVSTLVVAIALVVGLWSKRDDFVSALGDAPAWTLISAIALQCIWLVGRSEAWHVCVAAAGGDVERRRLYRAAAVGYLGNLFNPSFGLGVRIAALRRSAPVESPGVGVLITAEMPIVVIEMMLAAICSFTLVAPLDAPWWVPLVCLSVALVAIVVVTRVAHNRHHSFWAGLAVMRGLASRNTIIALVIFAVLGQVARNWIVFHGLGVDISVFDSMALLIAAAAFGLLPVGPTLGIATSVVILGSNGVAIAAAAGALLTATGAVGALLFAGWAGIDRLAQRRSDRRTGPDPEALPAALSLPPVIPPV